MRMLLLIMLWIPLVASAREVNIFDEVARISTLEGKQHVHKALLQLREDNMAFKRLLIQSDEYRPDLFYYSVTLDLLLENIPDDLTDIPDCPSLRSDLMYEYHAETWEELEPPTHDIWPAFEKLCS